VPASQSKTSGRKGLQRIPVTVESVERPSEDLVLLRLSRPGGAEYGFSAGQFLYVFMPDDERKKPYSIASAPYEEDRLDLAVKKIDGGTLSPYLYDLEPGDTVDISRSLGGFVNKTPPDHTWVGLGTGTGVAPLRSMMRQMVHDGPERETWLFLGSATKRNLPYHEEFEGLDEILESFSYVPSCTREGMEWTGERGWIQEPFLEHFPHRERFHIYVCGIKRMVDDVSRLLADELDLPAGVIHKEKYV
jgi:ferredoxin-NADP reductase